MKPDGFWDKGIPESVSPAFGEQESSSEEAPQVPDERDQRLIHEPDRVLLRLAAPPSHHRVEPAATDWKNIKKSFQQMLKDRSLLRKNR